ncbi:hypothetical protein ACIREE_37710 [Streptomyces sp. NPDC102467]|uniref:hypothetical protein n=1 Tax=Streptomyces sp. NPDC102467 TaxID=3366179 RepID=UPI0037F10FDA
METDRPDDWYGSADGVRREALRLQESAAVADQRDTAADQREEIADRREEIADQREVRLAAWESRVDDRVRVAGTQAPGLRRQAYETLGRARGLLEASRERLDRSEAALGRADASDEREQRDVEREVSFSTALQADEGPAQWVVLEARERRLRRQFIQVAGARAVTQDALAGEYEQLALAHPQQETEYRQRAEQARKRAAGLRADVLAGGEESG